MKEVIELDEDDIIRILAAYIAEERSWGDQNHAGLTTLTISPATPGDGPYPGSPAKLTARVERVNESIVENGKLSKRQEVW